MFVYVRSLSSICINAILDYILHNSVPICHTLIQIKLCGELDPDDLENVKKLIAHQCSECLD